MEQAIKNMRDQKGRKVYADLLLIDAEKIDTQIAQVSIIKGDDRCYSIACASIVAKYIEIVFAIIGRSYILDII